MYIFHIIFIVFCFNFLFGIIKAIKEKSIKKMLVLFLFFLFVLSFYTAVLSGGSAFHNAENQYELYQEGKYYLVSHGNWTEVSYPKYLFVFLFEIIGFSSLIIASILSFFRNKK